MYTINIYNDNHAYDKHLHLQVLKHKVMQFFLKFYILGASEGPFELFKRVQLLMANIPHHKQAICSNRKKVAEQFLRNLAKCAKIAPFRGPWKP